MNKTNRWLILAACVLINLCLGAGYAWSVFQTPLMELFGFTTAEASLAFSISFAMVPVSMIIFGPRQDKQGPKIITLVGGLLFGAGMFFTGFTQNLMMLYITYGLILGFGIGMAYGCTTATTVKWFPDKRGLAGGLTAAGFGSGAIILAPVAVRMIEGVGVLTTFRILGIILLVVIVLSALILKNPSAETAKGRGSTAVTAGKGPKEMLQTANFWLLWVVYIAGCVAGMMIIGHASPIASSYMNFSPEGAALVVSIVGLANTLGRLFWGFVSDKIGRYYTILCMFVASSIGLFLITMVETVGSTLAIIGIAAVALSFGGFLGTFPGITAENWGPTNAGANYGVMFTAYGIAAIGGPRLAAVIRESQGSYSTAFYISIALAIVGILFLLLYMMKNKKKLA